VTLVRSPMVMKLLALLLIDYPDARLFLDARFILLLRRASS
jgi:hypothetical protein